MVGWRRGSAVLGPVPGPGERGGVGMWVLPNMQITILRQTRIRVVSYMRDLNASNLRVRRFQ